jgi:hypothetical protein
MQQKRTNNKQTRTNMLVLVGSGLAETIQASLVALVVAVREVESGDTHSFIDQILQSWDIPTSRTQSANNFGLSTGTFGLGHDRLQGDVGSSELGAAANECGLRLHGEKGIIICWS